MSSVTLEQLLEEVEKFGRNNVATWEDYERFKALFYRNGFIDCGKEIADALNL